MKESRFTNDPYRFSRGALPWTAGFMIPFAIKNTLRQSIKTETGESSPVEVDGWHAAEPCHSAG